jgi:alpha-glucosidase
VPAQPRLPRIFVLRVICFALIFLFFSHPLRAQWRSVGNVDSYVTRGGNSLTMKSGGCTLELRILAGDLVLVRFSPPPPAGYAAPAPSPSWAVTKTSWPEMKAEITDAPDAVTFATNAVRIQVNKRPLRIAFLDTAGNVIAGDDPQKGMAWVQRPHPDSLRDARGTAGTEVRVWKSMPEDERYYGFGERAGAFERRGTHMTMWNSDIPAYTAATDPLYQTIPFFLGKRGGRTYGIFFDNTYWSSFDMGKESRDRYSFGAEGGPLEYYFFAGPDPRTVIRRFTELVGRMPVPPRWSLGYQQSRWSYAPEARVRQIARGFRENRIPCDVLYLDIDYMEGYRVFTWNPTGFPDPRTLVRDLSADGFRTAVILDPGIKTDSTYAAYRSGLQGDVFLKYPDGRVFVGDVWPGRCAFPDFTSDGARRWWGDQLAPLAETGIRGWWNDMNEPSVFNVPTKTVDLQVLHDDRGAKTPHAKNHNVYGLLMTRATYEGALRALPAERPFVLTRASYAGGQRYSATWTGDNVSSWEHLEMALAMCLNLGLSGQPFVGSDIGGFIGYPSGELFARWLQLGVFTPLMRAHSVINEKNKEPWEFGPEFTAINRETINLRYKLLPFVYNVMVDAAESGLPALRPLLLEYPDDPRFSSTADAFLFGTDMLVAPILREGVRERDVELPRGAWYDYWTGERLDGGGRIKARAPLEHSPLFARSGSIIPSQQLMQYSSQAPINPLTLTVYPLFADGEATTPYYEDDGLSFDYLKGILLRRTHRQRRTGNTLTVTIGAAQGSYIPPSRPVEVRVVDAPRSPSIVLIDGLPVPRADTLAAGANGPAWNHLPLEKVIVIRSEDLRRGQQMEIRYE